MKNSKQYAERIQKLYRRLKRDYPKVQQACFDEPVEAIVYAIISENTTEAASQSINKKSAEYFVDLNELRASKSEEIAELLGESYPAAKETAAKLTKILMAIFNQHHKLSLQALKKMGKRPAKQALEKLEGISEFAVDYCMLTSLQAHAIPLTETMVGYLKSSSFVDPGADRQDIEGFLTRQIAAKDAYEFYNLLRRESESAAPKKRASHKLEKTAKADKAAD